MPEMLSFLPLLGPAALLVAAAVAHRDRVVRPRRALLATRLATWAAAGTAATSAALLALAGPLGSPVLGVDGLGISVRLDALSAIMFGLVAFVGAVVVQFSRNYLDGDARQGRFLGDLSLTLAAVMLLVLAGNLLQLVVAWVATSLALHRLLVFYPERPAAQLAARKKFLFARIGDASVALGAWLLFDAFGTADIAAILETARAALAAGAVPPGVPLAAGCIALAAVLKSAQFPTHGWLTEVMETPTPVSALLHAGLVNAGGFLLIRFADVMLLGSASLHGLALVGGFTALFGSLAMLTQTSIKVSLAFSTVAQMGFMILQCGLGAFSSAVLHIVAHSLYKAHAFLSSGSAVAAASPAGASAPHTGARGPLVVAALVASLATFLAVGAPFGFTVSSEPAIVALGAIFVLGMAHLLVRSLAGAPGVRLLAGASLAVAGIATAYFALQAGAATLLGAVLPGRPPADATSGAIIALVLVSFAAIAALQWLTPPAARAGWREAAYVHLSNGLYANALLNRLLGGLRLPRSART